MAEQTVKNILLDTHALIWASHKEDIKRIGKDALSAMENIEGRVCVSTITAYEITNKYRNGKFDEYRDIAEQYDEVLDRLDVEELPLTGKHAYDAGMMDWSHRDPFDRMLAAQARCEGLTLVTCDKAFDDAPGVEVLW